MGRGKTDETIPGSYGQLVRPVPRGRTKDPALSKVAFDLHIHAYMYTHAEINL